MSIMIGADIVPTRSNQDLFIKGDVTGLIGEDLKGILFGADQRIFNLETPLTDKEGPIRKHGPNLIAPAACVNGLKALKIDVFTLANNHIKDQDGQGIASTIALLDQAGIGHVGAGEDIHSAQKPCYREINGKRYGIYACAEHEFTIAGEGISGANPFDPLESLDHVAEMKENCDYAIVLYHGGKEHYRYPSPYLQKVCRKLVDKGADLVVCQHSHCIGCKEEYRNGTIVYGQGNFLFDDGDNEYWNSGILLSVNEDRTIDYLPLRKQGNGVRLAKRTEAQEILDAFDRRSAEIKSAGFVEEQYGSFAKAQIVDYIPWLSGRKKSFFFRALNKVFGKRIQMDHASAYIEQYGTAVRNYIECEAHRELILKGIRKTLDDQAAAAKERV